MEFIGIPFDQLQNDSALNIQFSESGYDSKQFLKNSGSSVFFIIIFILSWAFLLLFSLLSYFSNTISNIRDKLYRQLIWKQSLNLLLSQFPPLFLCSTLNLYDLRFIDRNVYITLISSYLSVIVLVTLIFLLLILLIKIWFIQRNSNREQFLEFKTNYSVLAESLKQTNRQKLIYFWKPLYLVRWALTLSILIGLADKPALQILSLLTLSIIWQCIILVSNPFESKPINIISFYNELAVSLYLYIAFLLSDFLDSEFLDDTQITNFRLIFAWILSGILVLTVFVNFMFAFVTIGSSALKYIKNKLTKQGKLETKYMERKTIAKNNGNQNDMKKSTDQTRLEEESYEHFQNSNQKKPLQSKNKKPISLPFEIKKVQIHDMYQVKK